MRRKKAAVGGKPAGPEAALVRTLPFWPQPAVTSPALLHHGQALLCSVLSKASLASRQARAEMFSPLDTGLLLKAGTCWEAKAEWRDIWPPFPLLLGKPTW